ncbi:S41 family peptidase [Psychroflexus sp. MES1-P1E]|uniref:S41 family peptidase n=1 Tax=Psychroflexus sp. MES1-P1E TaxID=2058320 RepID=UPI0035B555D4
MATGSSGEVTELAFKGRRNTIFIGEKTYGAMIANVRRNLSFGAFMALTTSYECDRKGNSMKKYFQTLKLLGRTILCMELVCLRSAER